MAYQFKSKFKAIENDKKNFDPNAKKINEANSIYGSAVMEMFNPTETINNMIEENNIVKISLDNIKSRSENDFAKVKDYSLKASIRKIGLLSPIIVRKTLGDNTNKYILISGHRRFEAFKGIVNDLKAELLEIEKAGESTKSKIEEIDKYSSIPSLVFTIVDDDSDLLGTEGYITREQEKLMYEAANLESRAISQDDLTKHIEYFYNQIRNDSNYRKQLLDERNKNAIRKSGKVNYPDIISDIITKDLKFPVSSTYIYRLVYMLERREQYPKYYDKCMKRLEIDETTGKPKNGMRTVYDDFKMAVELKNFKYDDKGIQREIISRIEKGNEPIANIYNEIKNKKVEKKKSKNISRSSVLEILNAVKDGNIDIKEAIKKVEDLA